MIGKYRCPYKYYSEKFVVKLVYDQKVVVYIAKFQYVLFVKNVEKNLQNLNLGVVLIALVDGMYNSIIIDCELK